MRLVASLIAIAALSACNQPTTQAPDTPAPTPQIAACNALEPDSARLVTVQDEAAVTMLADLRGGAITPGLYDLASAVRIGEATGWSGQRAVALEVTESGDAVVFNWAGATPTGETDTWTATFTDTPNVQLTFTCGRMGTVDAAFTASADAIDIRITDGASGSLYLVFQRRV